MKHVAPIVIALSLTGVAFVVGLEYYLATSYPTQGESPETQQATSLSLPQQTETSAPLSLPLFTPTPKSSPTNTPTPKPTKTPTPSPTKTITLKTCKSFLWQEDAQAYADAYGAGNMDGDNDGIVCEDLLSRTKYQNYNGVYKGNPCTGDCSGHEAGYNWASDHGISDISDCGGNSNSFIEGCISYVEENY